MQEDIVKYLFAFLLLVVSGVSHASDEYIAFKSQIESVAELYGDGYAKFLPNSIKTIDVTNAENGYCVTLVSFYMEGFSRGNNAAQFIVFLNCRSKKGDYDENDRFVKNVIGIHPFYFFRDSLDLSTASYSGRLVSIKSKKGNIKNFTNKGSIWWSNTE